MGTKKCHSFMDIAICMGTFYPYNVGFTRPTHISLVLLLLLLLCYFCVFGLGR